MSEALTLYKLIILYMLDKVNLPLTNSQISDFILEEGYTTYFTLQQAFSQLIDARLLASETIKNNSYYRITKEGEEALGFFADRISDAIKNDVNAYLAEKKLELKNEVSVVSDYYRLESHEYAVHCQVKEKRSNLIDLTVTVATEEEAAHLAGNWKDKSQQIYQYVMTTLFSKDPEEMH